MRAHTLVIKHVGYSCPALPRRILTTALHNNSDNTPNESQTSLHSSCFVVAFTQASVRAHTIVCGRMARVKSSARVLLCRERLYAGNLTMFGPRQSPDMEPSSCSDSRGLFRPPVQSLHYDPSIHVAHRDERRPSRQGMGVLSRSSRNPTVVQR